MGHAEFSIGAIVVWWPRRTRQLAPICVFDRHLRGRAFAQFYGWSLDQANHLAREK